MQLESALLPPPRHGAKPPRGPRPIKPIPPCAACGRYILTFSRGLALLEHFFVQRGLHPPPPIVSTIVHRVADLVGAQRWRTRCSGPCNLRLCTLCSHGGGACVVRCAGPCKQIFCPWCVTLGLCDDCAEAMDAEERVWESYQTAERAGEGEGGGEEEEDLEWAEEEDDKEGSMLDEAGDEEWGAEEEGGEALRCPLCRALVGEGTVCISPGCSWTALV